ncbi:hypothetical protein TFKS16_2392 [Tannerella forsythia KS16]|nr:hypothetical protein TFKS16_2392 [Tannerella forsythia KS16]
MNLSSSSRDSSRRSE